VELYTAPPEGSTVICADELGPVIPRTFPTAPGWSQGGTGSRAPLEYSRGRRRPGPTAGCASPTGRRSPQEGWWRIFRKVAMAGQDFANPGEIACATRVATAQLNAHARPWIWGRPRPRHRSYRRRFMYIL
jgi:hypothetical protein